MTCRTTTHQIPFSRDGRPRDFYKGYGQPPNFCPKRKRQSAAVQMTRYEYGYICDRSPSRPLVRVDYSNGSADDLAAEAASATEEDEAVMAAVDVVVRRGG